MPALKLSALRFAYRGEAEVVAGLDLTVAPGEFYALLGPNGAGKTTSLRLIPGLLKPQSGSIQVCGIDAVADSIEARKIIAWLPDEPMLYDALTPLEYLEFVAGLWGIDARIAQARAEILLNELDLWGQRDQRCGSFSRGMKQRACLAGSLIHEPRLLLLDEPLTGLDAAMARRVKAMLRARTQAGAAVILTTHILDVAERMADRIGILHHGRKIAEGNFAELAGQASHGNTTLEDVFLDLVERGMVE
ncbi:MAG: ABC transporter [Rhodospirillales bacterium 20-60-12]|nr:MAG: ABC transporter [Rhodospirillales bacterium 20-60-12]HQT67635.1 ABC transporter ATP-binding protein [Acetobacteraceae bacterium]